VNGIQGHSRSLKIIENMALFGRPCHFLSVVGSNNDRILHQTTKNKFIVLSMILLRAHVCTEIIADKMLFTGIG